MTEFNTEMVKKNLLKQVEKAINFICELFKFDKTNGLSYLIEANMMELL